MLRIVIEGLGNIVEKEKKFPFCSNYPFYHNVIQV